jgi:7-cyano-7-deazaguanine synthase in queuosine biosynthesis
MSIWDSVVKYKRYKLAIMWSGGMDTTIAYYYALDSGYKNDDIVMIHVDIGQPYEWKEKNAIDMIRSEIGEMNYLEFKFNLLREELKNLPTPEKQVIPGRNLLMAYVGSVFADRVWICALDGEMHRYMTDKNHTFFELASGVLSYVMDRDIIVETPFKEMSKSEIAKWFVDLLGREKAQKVLDKTVTCYDERNWACGECSTCFKRWVAYVNAGLNWRKYWKVNPRESEVARDLIKRYEEAKRKKDFSHYSEKRIMETLRALEVSE